ncbi:replicative DNA helicase [Clostridium sp.]|uniref:replicative DNA helicase n=1 Tax=Clostridium sp. TaxID=1506 RepID=UPI0034645DB5
MELTSLPWSLDAEVAVLGAILNGEDFEEVLTLSTKDFYKTSHQFMFNAIKSLDGKGRPVDLVTLIEELKISKTLDEVTVTYASEISNAYLIGTNIKSYVDIVKDYSRKRELIAISRSINHKVYNGLQVSEIISSVEDNFSKMQLQGSNDIYDIGKCLESTINQMERNYHNKGALLGASTGFTNIDKHISGLCKGDFIVIAARPSMGKTAFALNLALNVISKKNKVAIFSLEMAKEQLMHRILACESRIELNKIRLGKLNEDEWVKVCESSSYLSTRSLSIDDKAGITVSEIKAKCKRMKKSRGLDVVLIDYLQLIESNDSESIREQQIAKISRELKKMAKELEITVIALSQLSRAPEQRNDKRPILADLRESGTIEQDADIVMFLYRDEYYYPESEEKQIADIILGKNRNGETVTCKLAWLGQYQKFAQIALR